MRTLFAIILGLIMLGVIGFVCAAAGIVIGGNNPNATATWSVVAFMVISTIFYLIDKAGK
jgi:hypothetical protein